MATVRKTLADLKTNPPKFTPADRTRLDALTPDEIERMAAADVDNPPMTDAELARAAFARDVRRARERTGLAQAKFSERYRINLSRLRDWEQGRFAPDSVALAYLKVIEHEPELVERALRSA